MEVRLLEDPETFLVQFISTARRWRVLIASSVSRLSVTTAHRVHYPSEHRRSHEYAIVPDAATCPACLAEMNTPGDGVIVIRLSTVPTAAHVSPLSRDALRPPVYRDGGVSAVSGCDKEYRDPLDRRFHAQPVACRSVAPILNG